MSGRTAARSRRRHASGAQLRAVYTVMRILAEDDRGRGASPSLTVPCQSCRRDRPAAGSVEYAEARLCNGCATDYEVLKISGIVDDLAGYLDKAG